MKKIDLKNPNTRNLAIILATLCVVAITLVVLVVIRASQSQKPAISQDTNSESDVKAEKEYNDYVTEFDNLQSKMAQVEASEPAAINNVVSDYITAIKSQQASGATGRASSLIIEAYDAMIQTGNYQPELLEILKAFDYTSLDEFSQYKLYSIAAELATKLGDNETATRFTALRDGGQANYNAHVEGTEDYRAYVDKVMRESEGGNQ